MTHQRSSTTTVAILGSDTLAEHILARLLQHEGYATRLIEAYPSNLVDEQLDDVDALILAPGLDAEMSGVFLGAMRSTPRTAAIPVLSLPATLKLALLDELATSASWRSLFEELVGQIGAALEGAAASARTLLVDGGESPEGISS